MSQLHSIVETIRNELEVKERLRDETLRRARQLTRYCANAIRAVHRGERAEAEQLLQAARTAAAEMTDAIADHPDLYYAGYTQDALKELSEAHLTYALISDQELPTPQMLGVPSPAYLNGLAEAMGELRRCVLDRLRQDDVATGERLLDVMDEVYTLLITVDFSEAVTGGLRRNTDTVRAVLERTRGDLTTAVRQEEMKAALREFSAHSGLDGSRTIADGLSEALGSETA
jgi:translin